MASSLVKVKVYVTLKESVLDPQGETVAKALKALGFSEVEKVRLGKVIYMEISDGEGLKERVKEMCERLLANPVIEDYHFEIEKEK
jgi:phosphoribosylformylglycinamidine synthase